LGRQLSGRNSEAVHMRFDLRSWPVAIVMLVGVAFVASGCGVRGTLKLPPAADSGQGKPAGKAPKPHKPFFLDGLLK
jgi:predicted small lipoprotein YifL